MSGEDRGRPGSGVEFQRIRTASGVRWSVRGQDCIEMQQRIASLRQRQGELEQEYLAVRGNARASELEFMLMSYGERA